MHAAAESDELRAITNSAGTRIKELAFFTGDAVKKLIKDEGVIVIGYKSLFDLQRRLKN